MHALGRCGYNKLIIKTPFPNLPKYTPYNFEAGDGLPVLVISLYSSLCRDM